MHFVTGGAFNGKRKWVKKKYQNAKWISAYENGAFVEDLSFLNSPVIVVEGLEFWVKELNLNRVDWKETIANWGKWEKVESARQVVIIGTDITKGIVPVEKENRIWRDVTGWVYQDVVAACEQVDVIWYGIHQTIKG